MSYSLASRASSSAAAALEAEYKLKAEQQAEYVKQLWLFLTAVIGLLTIVNWTRRLLRTLRSPKLGVDKTSAFAIEAIPFPSGPLPTGRHSRISFRRIPQMLSSIFRAFAFRTTFPIGPSSVMSVAELTFIIGYIVALLVWLWVNSECFCYSRLMTVSDGPAFV